MPGQGQEVFFYYAESAAYQIKQRFPAGLRTGPLLCEPRIGRLCAEKPQRRQPRRDNGGQKNRMRGASKPGEKSDTGRIPAAGPFSEIGPRYRFCGQKTNGGTQIHRFEQGDDGYFPSGPAFKSLNFVKPNWLLRWKMFFAPFFGGQSKAETSSFAAIWIKSPHAEEPPENASAGNPASAVNF